MSSIPVRQTAATAAAAAALILGLAACSSSPSAPGAAPTGADHEAFATCLTDHGVPAPPEGRGPGGEPPTGPPPSGAPGRGEGGAPPAPPGVDSETWDAAMQACASLAPEPPARS